MVDVLDTGSLPVFDLDSYIQTKTEGSDEAQELCRQLAQCLRDTSCLVVRARRASLPHLFEPDV